MNPFPCVFDGVGAHCTHSIALDERALFLQGQAGGEQEMLQLWSMWL